ncbi:MAG: argininosuccinate lyase [Clostridia bacterium]|nr:argininosuccinate lyase [Clostridia bacterium]
MAKLWAGRTEGATSALADDFNSSVSFDCRMVKEDIEGSMAHAAMLAKCEILTADEAETLRQGLAGILSDIEEGKLAIDMTAEDVHMFVEAELTKRLGDVGKKLHTARSRNDQVALDMRLTVRKEIDLIRDKVLSLLRALTKRAEEYQDVIMPGYTHLQRAQPILFAHHLLAYACMLERDLGRLCDARRRVNISPIGSCALAGTTYPTDRRYEAGLLGFDEVCRNSMDGVSDRDFCLETLSDIAILMTHLSRLSEEIVLWSGWEFRFIELSDAYTTGSSIMPQKKNPDMAELARGKCGRVYGDLMAMFTVLKGLPLAYNKDMQEDKESVFDALDTVKNCLDVMTGMIETFRANPERMYRAAGEGFINATDLADYLVKKGMPFRSAYKIAGQIVADCIAKGLVLENYPLSAYREKSDLFDEDVFEEISLAACVAKRVSEGGTGYDSVKKQIAYFKETYG